MVFYFEFVGLLSFFCPCIQFGRNAEALGESCVMYALSQFVPFLNLYCKTMVRGRIREQKGIEGTCLQDLLCSWCCYKCTIAQEAQVCVQHCLFNFTWYFDLYCFFNDFYSGVARTWGSEYDSWMNRPSFLLIIIIYNYVDDFHNK